MVWWWTARDRVTWLALAVVASCSVDDDDDYIFETEPKEVSGDAGEAADLGAAGADGSDPRGGAESGGGTAGLGGGSSGGSVGQGASPVAGGESGNAGGLASSGGTLDATGGTTEPPTSTGGASTTPESCDCGAPECGEGVCVPAVPSGWSGPILLFHGAPSLAPECTGYLNKTAFEGGTVPLQERLRCSACTCQETSGAECAALVTTYSVRRDALHLPRRQPDLPPRIPDEAQLFDPDGRRAPVPELLVPARRRLSQHPRRLRQSVLQGGRAGVRRVPPHARRRSGDLSRALPPLHSRRHDTPRGVRVSALYWCPSRITRRHSRRRSGDRVLPLATQSAGGLRCAEGDLTCGPWFGGGRRAVV